MIQEKVKITWAFAERHGRPPSRRLHAKLHAEENRRRSGEEVANMTIRGSRLPSKALCIVALAVPILVVFAAAVALLALVLAHFRDTALDESGTLTLACICALVAGLFFLVFHCKHETVVVPCKDRPTFLMSCRAVLRDLGYEVHMKSTDELVSRPSFRSLLLGGRIHVEAARHEVTLSGPKVFVEILRRRLRVRSHLASAEQRLRDPRIHHGDRLLKRVQISLRFTSGQWSEVGQVVLDQLSAEGCEISCEVHLMAQSPEGIRESLIDGPLRDWFKEGNIHAEVHKDHARWEEPLSRTAPEPMAGQVEEARCPSTTSSPPC
jgi:hypothetical protein